MSFLKLDTALQLPLIETIEEKYELEKQLGGYSDLAKRLFEETAGTVGLNIANEQVKAFLTNYIPSIIINVTNIYGTKIGGKLLSQIQMTLMSTLTGGLGFNSLMDTVMQTVSLGSASMLGLSEDSSAVQTMHTLLQAPLSAYAKKLGYASYIPQAVSFIPFSGTIGTTAGHVGKLMKQPLKVYSQAREIYLTPFTLLSDWMADNTAQLIVNEIRDPYLNDTLIPAFKQTVDNLLPKRDTASNFDPLETQDEHSYDVAKKNVSSYIAQYHEFKKNSNLLVYFMLELGEVVGNELVYNTKLQDVLVHRIGGDNAKQAFQVTRKVVSNTYTVIKDENTLSNVIAEWMQENFVKLAKKASDSDLTTIAEHIGLFKQAFSGKILTKYELDTIKGKSIITRLIEGGLSSGYNAFKKYIVSDSREKFQDFKNEIVKAISEGNYVDLYNFFNLHGEANKSVVRNIILKNQRLDFKSEVNGLPITPLMSAIETGNLDLIQLIIEECQNQNVTKEGVGLPGLDLDQYSAGITPLQRAIMKNHHGTVQYLINKNVNLVKPSIIGGATPLMIAAKNGNLDIVETLLSYKSVKETIDSKGFRGRTALHYAMKNGHMKVAEQLIENGANLFLKDANGYTPLGLLYDELQRKISSSKLTKNEAEQNFEGCLQELQPALKNIIHQFATHQSALLASAKSAAAQSATAKLATASKTDPVARSYLRLAINIGCKLDEIDGNPWFNRLFEQKEMKLISKLMNDPNNSELINYEMWQAVTVGEDALSILKEALSIFNASEITSKLIEFTELEFINDSLKDFNPSKINDNSFSFLRFESLNQLVINSIIQRQDFKALNLEILRDIFNHQIKNGQLDSLKLILKYCPKLLDEQDSLLNSPLHYSLKYGRYEITQFLLDQGADITLKNKNGDTAYESWSKNNTFLNKLLDTITFTKRESVSENDKLAKAFALNMVQINDQFDKFEKEISSTPVKEQPQKIYESLSTLINKDSKDEIRNELISKILQRADSDLGLFSINQGTNKSLIIQAIIKNDYILFDVFIKSLMAKDPSQREDICQFFINELLSAPIAENLIIKGMEVILKLPDNENNALLSLSDKKLRLPSEIAFQNKKYSVMAFILDSAPQYVSLKMMNYILINQLPCAKKVFEINQELIASNIMNEDVEEVVGYLSMIWNRPQNDFNLALFKTYFLNASGEAINQFLKAHKITGYIHNSPITMEQFVSKFNDDELTSFIDNKFKFLSDNRKLEFLELAITKGQMDYVRSIIEAHPELLNLQLSELGNRTPLHIAVNNQNWKMAHFFMLKGGLVNLKSNDNNTAYDDWFKASITPWISNNRTWEHSKIDKILSDGADLEKLNAYSRKSGSIQIMMLFNAQEIDKNIDIDTSQEEKIKIIVERIQMILNSPNKNILNGMPLEDYLIATQVLIDVYTQKHGITLDELFSYKLPNTNGNTLLHQAINTKSKIMTDFILEYPVNLNLQNDEGNTPLHLTIKNDDPNLTKNLIKRGSSVDLANNTNKTAINLIESARTQTTNSYTLFKPANMIGAQSTELIALIAECVKPQSENINEAEKVKAAQNADITQNENTEVAEKSEANQNADITQNENEAGDDYVSNISPNGP